MSAQVQIFQDLWEDAKNHKKQGEKRNWQTPQDKCPCYSWRQHMSLVPPYLLMLAHFLITMLWILTVLDGSWNKDIMPKNGNERV